MIVKTDVVIKKLYFLIIKKFRKKYIKHCFLIINQHIRMIYVGSCDTEAWSNDAEYTVLHHRNIF